MPCGTIPASCTIREWVVPENRTRHTSGVRAALSRGLTTPSVFVGRGRVDSRPTASSAARPKSCFDVSTCGAGLTQRPCVRSNGESRATLPVLRMLSRAPSALAFWSDQRIARVVGTFVGSKPTTIWDTKSGTGSWSNGCAGRVTYLNTSRLPCLPNTSPSSNVGRPFYLASL